MILFTKGLSANAFFRGGVGWGGVGWGSRSENDILVSYCSSYTPFFHPLSMSECPVTGAILCVSRLR